MLLDEMRGKAAITAETHSALASVTFWNTDDVEVLTVDKATRRESTLDDWVLAPVDNIDSLLNRYFLQIGELAAHPCRDLPSRFQPSDRSAVGLRY